ncbi:MAG: large conductance mechanosensitive channel protein MscL [Raoultibacter sp.]|jgi:large conductance mechanosensitive channel
MKKFLEEFKEFINRGNVMDLAVAVVIGTAFTAIVNSVVADLIMPLVSALTGGIQFTDMKLVIPIGAGESAITYGNFLNAVIQFLVIAFVVFCIVKAMNSMRRIVGVADETKPEDSVTCPYCKEAINKEATRCPHCTAEMPYDATALTHDDESAGAQSDTGSSSPRTSLFI